MPTVGPRSPWKTIATEKYWLELQDIEPRGEVAVWLFVFVAWSFTHNNYTLLNLYNESYTAKIILKTMDREEVQVILKSDY